MQGSSQAAVPSYITKEYGGAGEEVTTEVIVSAAVTRLVKSDPDRLGLLFVNLGTDSVYLTPDNRPSTTRGLFLVNNGGQVSLFVKDDLTLPSREWYATTASGISTVYVVEIRRFTVTG